MKFNTITPASAPVDISRRALRAKQLLDEAQLLMESINPSAVSPNAALVLVEVRAALWGAAVTTKGFIEEMPQKRSWTRRPAAEAAAAPEGEEPNFIEI